MVPMGRCSRVVRAHIHELALTSVSPYWLLFVPRATLMDRLDRRGTFFWIGLPRISGMVNGVEAESC